MASRAPASSAPAALSTRTRLLALFALAAFTALLAALLPSSSPALPLARTAHYAAQLSAMRSALPPRSLRVGSWNVRYDYAARHPLSALGEGEKRWAERRDRLVDQVRWEELDVVGFQEVLHSQLEDLRALLPEEEWGSVGVGRNDGRHAGEAVPIFFRRSALRLVRPPAHRWLSPTPLKPGSKGWDAGQPRMVTIAWLAVVDAHGEGAGAEVLVGNTHWDDRGVKAREESAKLVRALVEEELRAHGREGADPLVVLLGDLNSPAEEEGYQLLTGRRYPASLSSDAPVVVDEASGAPRSFFDARHEHAVRGSALAGPGALSARFGPLNTFTGFSPSDVPKVIDFILPFANAAFLPLSSSSTPHSSSENGTTWKVARYGVLPNFFTDLGGRGPEGREGASDAMVRSDHRLVVARFEEVVAAGGAEDVPARVERGEGKAEGAPAEGDAAGGARAEL